MKGVAGTSRRGAASRDAILQAAVRVIGREGLAGASLAAVAKEANTSKPAVLYHFGSREHLLHEVASLALGLYRTVVEPAERGVTPRARTEAAIAAIFAPENRTLLGCVHELVGLSMRDPAVAELMRKSLEDVLQGPTFALGKLLPGEEARAIARALIMTVHGHVELWLCSDPADSKQFVDSVSRATLALLPNDARS
ncbi:MAG TPA: TetR/AcrR family transcriptional regulator [Myxococcota bacterium]|nr:TetR/AcrR family transcriptional regulator [Myxococcota bacterium]